MGVKESKKIMQAVLVATVVFCVFISTVKARAQNIYSYITNNGAITITSYFVTTSGSVTIPDIINGYPVTALADYSFQQNPGLFSVTIGSNLTSIGTSVFSGCTALSSFYVSSQNASFSANGGVLYNKTGSTLVICPIANSAFVSIPPGVTSIGNDAFDSCKFSSITLPNGLTNISSSAFKNATSLGSITIPGNVANIGDSVFLGCTSLVSISVNSTNLHFSSTNGILYDKTGQTLIAYPENESATNYVIPNSVTMVISNAVAFCAHLTNITVSSNVTSIGGGAFSECANLKTITVDPQNNFYSSSNGVLFDKSASTLITFPGGIGGSYSIPNTVSNVQYSAFLECGSLASVTVPDSVTNIGNSAFLFCYALTNIVLGSNLTTIGSQAFEFCNSLKGINFDTNLISIGNAAFENCTSLTNLVIPDSVTSIGAQAFAGCSKVTNITIGKGVTTISNLTFTVCASLTNIVIPGTVTNLGSAAFEDCSALTNVDFLGSPPTADSSVFFVSGVKAVYYLPNTSGWGPTFAGLPTALWLPSILANPKQAPFGIQAGQFDFTVSWASNLSVVIQSCTNLLNSSWSPVATNVLTNGIWQFSDAASTNYSPKFYRVSAQ